MRVVLIYDHGRGQALPWVVSDATYERFVKPCLEAKKAEVEMDYVCADCGTENESMQQICPNCKSVRVVLKSFIEEHFGKDWRESFEPNADPVTPDHPEVKAAEEHGQKILARLFEDGWLRKHLDSLKS